MKKSIVLLGLLLITNALLSQVNRPKLVVGIIVDQMRYEYLNRFYNDFGNEGFKRLMRQGYNFKNMHFNYMPTVTASGHSSVYTGTTPAIHGIVGNRYYNKSLGKMVYCTYDDAVSEVGKVGNNGKEGKMSPHNLKVTTITDELKLSTNFKGKVIGVSLKDRASILPAGHFADAAYWVSNSGDFITSDFYMKKLPDWVVKFNGQNLAQKYINKGWHLLKDKSDYDESISDNNPYEYLFKTKKTPTFPYILKQIEKKQGKKVFKTTPFGDDLVLDFALSAIKNEMLGKDQNTDFLTISFSSPDIIAHRFGPRSVEIQDTYLRLDRNIASLIQYLDKNVGQGQYLLFLTADHAGAENPAFLNDLGYKVKSLDAKDFGSKLKAHLKDTYGYDLLKVYYNQNIFLDEGLIRQKNLNYEKIVEDVKHFSQKQPYVKRAYTRKEILASSASDYFLQMIERGYDPKQNGDLVILLEPGYMEYGFKGTTHGSVYTYDTHVPNLWFGWGIKHGETSKRKTITEIAPTISQLIHITFPNGSHSNVLDELLK